VNVDYSDKRHQLEALVNHLNESFGKRVAVGFTSDRKIGFEPSERPRRFFEDPAAFIPEMIEKGIRIFISSPVVSTGWRYKGSPRFDATLSIYSLGIQTAPAIVQQLQRCVGVKEHFLFIGPPGYTIKKGLVEEVLNGEGCSDKRAAQMDIDDILSLLSAFNSKDIHFS
jgi:hypothetical protein